MTSQKRTVTLHEGTTDVLQAMLRRVQDTRQCLDQATDYDDLRAKLRETLDHQRSLLDALVSRLTGTECYGDLHLAPEMFDALSLQWWHDAPETMHGGINYHQRSNRWSVNT